MSTEHYDTRGWGNDEGRLNSIARDLRDGDDVEVRCADEQEAVRLRRTLTFKVDCRTWEDDTAKCLSLDSGARARFVWRVEQPRKPDPYTRWVVGKVAAGESCSIRVPSFRKDAEALCGELVGLIGLSTCVQRLDDKILLHTHSGATVEITWMFDDPAPAPSISARDWLDPYWHIDKVREKIKSMPPPSAKRVELHTQLTDDATEEMVGIRMEFEVREVDHEKIESKIREAAPEIARMVADAATRKRRARKAREATHRTAWDAACAVYGDVDLAAEHIHFTHPKSLAHPQFMWFDGPGNALYIQDCWEPHLRQRKTGLTECLVRRAVETLLAGGTATITRRTKRAARRDALSVAAALDAMVSIVEHSDHISVSTTTSRATFRWGSNGQE